MISYLFPVQGSTNLLVIVLLFFGFTYGNKSLGLSTMAGIKVVIIYLLFVSCKSPGLITGLVSLAFTGSIGMTFVILACALYNNVWWPFFVVLFYVLCPIPTMIARKYTDTAGGTNSTSMETAIFITMGFLVSSFALPIVLAHSHVIEFGACMLTLAGNVIVHLTILGFFTIFDSDDSDYAMW